MPGVVSEADWETQENTEWNSGFSAMDSLFDSVGGLGVSSVSNSEFLVKSKKMVSFCEEWTGYLISFLGGGELMLDICSLLEVIKRIISLRIRITKRCRISAMKRGGGGDGFL